MKLIELEETQSTNIYAKKYLETNNISEDILIFTYYQTKGRGNGKNFWHSEKNKNIIFSLIVKPKIEIKKIFLLSMQVSISICKYLKINGINAKIKWPNDIYIENKKICGILIENHFCGGEIKNSIIGVGLNLNETNFPKNLPNPVSMKNITKKNYQIKEETMLIANIIIENLKEINNIYFEIKEKYFGYLYRFNEFHFYKENNNIFKGKIIDIETDGMLIIETQEKIKRKFYFKEIEFIIS